MDCPDCGIPNVERLHAGTFGHWCPARGVPVQNERRRYAPVEDPDAAQAADMGAEWLEWVAALPETEEDHGS